MVDRLLWKHWKSTFILLCLIGTALCLCATLRQPILVQWLWFIFNYAGYFVLGLILYCVYGILKERR